MKHQRLMSPQHKSKKLDVRINKIGNCRQQNLTQLGEVKSWNYTSPKHIFSNSKIAQRPMTAVKSFTGQIPINKQCIKEIITRLKKKQPDSNKQRYISTTDI